MLVLITDGRRIKLCERNMTGSRNATKATSSLLFEHCESHRLVGRQHVSKELETATKALPFTPREDF